MPIIRDFNKDLVPMDNPIEARKNDLIRVTEWLASPAGLKFAGKQALLRTTGNLDSFSRKDILKAAGRGAADAASAIAMILAQVPLNGTGTHFLFNELSSLAFQQDSFYAGNRNAANQANYKGTVNIKVKKPSFRKSNSEIGEAKKSDGIGKSFVQENESQAVKDLIAKDTLPVVFSIAGESKSTLVFRGFVQGINDSYNANWNGYNYVGRGETLYTYSSSTRTLSFQLTIPIFSKQEQEPVYRKVNSLLSHVYPKYGDSNLAQGTLTKLRLGDYINSYGVITSITSNIAVEVPWSSADSYYGGQGNNLILPQVLILQIGMNVIHEKLPERHLGERTADSLPFIATAYKPSQLSESDLPDFSVPDIEFEEIEEEVEDNFIDLDSVNLFNQVNF